MLLLWYRYKTGVSCQHSQRSKAHSAKLRILDSMYQVEVLCSPASASYTHTTVQIFKKKRQFQKDFLTIYLLAAVPLEPLDPSYRGTNQGRSSQSAAQHYPSTPPQSYSTQPDTANLTNISTYTPIR